MKKLLFFAAWLLVSTAIMAQKSGGITADILSEIEHQCQSTPSEKALRNAIATNNINDLALNADNRGSVDSHFSVETPSQSIHNQKQSGRCWMFSGLNVLRANFAKAHEDTLAVEYSQAYLFFYDQLEKANLMLQGVIDCANKPIDDPRVQFFFRNPISDGGTFCGVSDLADKYGLVPMSVMPETYSAENTSRMAALLSSKLREYGLELRQMVADDKSTKAIEKRKTEMLSTVYGMLSLSLGRPVKQFSYVHHDKQGNPVGEAHTYTPMEFYKETVDTPLTGSYIMVMNDPRRPYHKTYEVEFDRHTYDGQNWRYLNLPMDEIAQLAIASLKDGRKLYSSYDVGKQFDRKRAYLDTENYDYGSLFGTTFGMNKAQRISTFDSGSTHAMTLSAVDLNAEGKPLKWKVENSWGADGPFGGCLVMTNRWFDEYMFRLVVDKKYVSAQLLQEYEQTPQMVMPEDPLFMADTQSPDDLDSKYATSLVKAGEQAPEFSLPTPLGNNLALSGLRGRYVVVDFWASWCPDCHKDLPRMVELQKKYGERGVEFIGISFDTDKTALTNAIDKFGLVYPQLCELKKMKESAVASAYGIQWIPSMYLIDPEGRVVLSTVMIDKLAAGLTSISPDCCETVGEAKINAK